MEVSEKRALLVAIDTLITKPQMSTEQTLIDVFVQFKALVADITEKKIIVHYEMKD